MKRSEPVGECGCQLVRDKDGLKMIDCPLHRAAPELSEACKDFVAFDWENSNLHWPTIAMWISRFQNIIAKAEGGE